MDGYRGKKICNELSLARKGSRLALSDSQSANRSGQYCNRLGCSSRLDSSKGIEIRNSERGKRLKPSFHSSSSKTIIGGSFKPGSGVNDVKRSHSSQQKGIVLDRSIDPRREAGNTAPGCITAIETGCSEAREAEGSLFSDIDMNPTNKEVECSSSTSKTRTRRQAHQSSGSNQGSPEGSLVRRNLPSRVSSIASRSSQCPILDSRQYGLRNFRCSSVPDVLASRCSSDSRRDKSINISKNKTPIGESSSARGRSSTRPSTRGTSNIHRNASTSTRLSERSLAQQAIERARNRSLGNNSVTGTRRMVGSTSRVQLAEHANDGSMSQSEPLLLPHSLETEFGINEALNSSSQPFFSESSSSSRSSYARELGSSDETSLNQPIIHTEGNRAWTCQTLSLDRSGFQHFNMDGIAQVLLALERIEQDEELTPEQLLVLETNLLLGGLTFHDQHRDMRLDIDNMSYEELLALEEQMGTVSTALSEEELSKCLERCRYVFASPVAESSGAVDSKCSICQEEYIEGDEIGKLQCEHRYHVACIHQWLSLKNWCPICKACASSCSSS